jgi:predicted DNA-binding protein
MDKTHSVIRITREAHRKLRLIAAMTGKSIVATMDEMTEAKLAELERTQKAVAKAK